MPYVVLRSAPISGRQYQAGEVLPDDTYNIGGLVHLGLAQYFQEPSQAQTVKQQAQAAQQLARKETK